MGGAGRLAPDGLGGTLLRPISLRVEADHASDAGHWPGRWLRPIALISPGCGPCSGRGRYASLGGGSAGRISVGTVRPMPAWQGRRRAGTHAGGAGSYEQTKGPSWNKPEPNAG
jgi:hypothetical protein